MFNVGLIESKLIGSKNSILMNNVEVLSKRYNQLNTAQQCEEEQKTSNEKNIIIKKVNKKLENDRKDMQVKQKSAFNIKRYV